VRLELTEYLAHLVIHARRRTSENDASEGKALRRD
jgi:hypothetical protein